MFLVAPLSRVSSVCPCCAQISRLPLKIETLGQVRRKTELEAKLKEIEDAIIIFSKDKVFIAAE